MQPGAWAPSQHAAGFLNSGWTLTSEFIQINEMKSAGSPDLIRVVYSLVVNNLCNKGLRLLA